MWMFAAILICGTAALCISCDSHGDRHLGMGACFHVYFFAIFLMVS